MIDRCFPVRSDCSFITATDFLSLSVVVLSFWINLLFIKLLCLCTFELLAVCVDFFVSVCKYNSPVTFCTTEINKFVQTSHFVITMLSNLTNLHMVSTRESAVTSIHKHIYIDVLQLRLIHVLTWHNIL